MDSPNIEIIETTTKHLRYMAEAMDSKTAEDAIKLGLTPKQALWRSYKQSILCRTALINGEIAAIWGLSGPMFGEMGRPWLVMTPEVQKHPHRVAFRYRQELSKMLDMFPVLEEYVSVDNEKSIRLLELMGFKFKNGDTHKIGEANMLRAERSA